MILKLQVLRKDKYVFISIFRNLHTCIKIEYNNFKKKDIHFFKYFLSKKYFHL